MRVFVVAFLLAAAAFLILFGWAVPARNRRAGGRDEKAVRLSRRIATVGAAGMLLLGFLLLGEAFSDGRQTSVYAVAVFAVLFLVCALSFCGGRNWSISVEGETLAYTTLFGRIYRFSVPELRELRQNRSFFLLKTTTRSFLGDRQAKNYTRLLVWLDLRDVPVTGEGGRRTPTLREQLGALAEMGVKPEPEADLASALAAFAYPVLYARPYIAALVALALWNVEETAQDGPAGMAALAVDPDDWNARLDGFPARLRAMTDGALPFSRARMREDGMFLVEWDGGVQEEWPLGFAPDAACAELMRRCNARLEQDGVPRRFLYHAAPDAAELMLYTEPEKRNAWETLLDLSLSGAEAAEKPAAPGAAQ